MANNYNNRKIYQNKLIVTKDINKKNKLKQEIIDKNQNDSFVIFDENGYIYNKEKENLLKNGYNIKTLNFIKGEDSNNYDPFLYLQHSECPYRHLFRWISNKKNIFDGTIAYFLQFLSKFSNDENKSIKNFIEKLNNKTLDGLNNKQIDNIKKDLKKWFPTFFDKETKKIILEDTLHLNNLNNEKTAIFIIYNKNKNNYMQLTKLFIHQLYNILYENDNWKKNNNSSFIFIFDDFDNFNFYHSGIKLYLKYDKNIKFYIFMDKFKKINNLDDYEELNSYLLYCDNLQENIYILEKKAKPLEENHYINFLDYKIEITKYNSKEYEEYYSI